MFYYFCKGEGAHSTQMKNRMTFLVAPFWLLVASTMIGSASAVLDTYGAVPCDSVDVQYENKDDHKCIRIATKNEACLLVDCMTFGS